LPASYRAVPFGLLAVLCEFRIKLRPPNKASSGQKRGFSPPLQESTATPFWPVGRSPPRRFCRLRKPLGCLRIHWWVSSRSCTLPSQVGFGPARTKGSPASTSISGKVVWACNVISGVWRVARRHLGYLPGPQVCHNDLLRGWSCAPCLQVLELCHSVFWRFFANSA